MMEIGIVDDKSYLRQSLKNKLAGKDVAIIMECNSGIAFLDAMKQSSKHPQLVLMDIEMPEMNGIDAIAIASSLYPNVKFVILTVFDDDDKIFAAIKAGASGYLLKDESAAEIIKAITIVIEEDATPMSPSIARKTWQWLTTINQLPVKAATQLAVDTEKYELLTPKEILVLQQCMDGKNYKEIADSTGLSPHTIRQHIKNIYKKLHVNNKIEAIKVGVKNKWI